MVLFLRLLLAHFIGDTILQPDEVYRIKEGGFYGVVVHSFIIFFSLAVFALPYLKHLAVWIVIIFASLTHLAQDEFKMRRPAPRRHNFAIFIFDQIMHIIFLTPVLFLPVAHDYPFAGSLWGLLYNNNALIVFCIGFIVAVFLGAYIWEAYKVSYFSQSAPIDQLVLKYGMFERAIIVMGVFFSVWPILLIPFFFRIFIKTINFSWQFLFNGIYSLVIALLLRRFIMPIF